MLLRLEDEFRQAGKADLFNALRGWLLVDDARDSHAAIAARVNVTEAAVKQTVYRLRRRYRELLRDEIAQTVDGPDEVDEEVRYLLAILAG